jgi:hypothetical protein
MTLNIQTPWIAALRIPESDDALSRIVRVAPSPVYACNYSLGHKLKKRPPEDRTRLLSDPLFLLSLSADDPAFIGYLADAQVVFDGMLEIDPRKDAAEVHAMTFGLRRMVWRLLVFAYELARKEQRERKNPVKVTMTHLRDAYECVSYEDDARTVDRSFDALLGIRGDEDYVCPFDLPAPRQALLTEIADRRRRYAINTAAAAASQTRQERVAREASQPRQDGSKTRVTKAGTQRRGASPPRTARDLLAGL